MTVDPQHLRMAEALLFAAVEPLDEASLAKRLPEGVDIDATLDALAADYRQRGVHLAKVAGRWSFFTAPDLAFLLEEHRQTPRRLSRAALETLAIIAYHQPVTRAEIEEIRGVGLSKGTLDLLLETGWVRMRGRRRMPGRPLTYGTTDDFLIHFGLPSLEDLPGLADLKAAGLLEVRAQALRLPESAALEEEPVQDTANDLG
jgi:segregation and condensation protein B